MFGKDINKYIYLCSECNKNKEKIKIVLLYPDINITGDNTEFLFEDFLNLNPILFSGNIELSNKKKKQDKEV